MREPSEDSMLISILCIAIMLLIGVLSYNSGIQALDKCKKDNNVYKCEMVAVPFKDLK